MCKSGTAHESRPFSQRLLETSVTGTITAEELYRKITWSRAIFSDSCVFYVLRAVRLSGLLYVVRHFGQNEVAGVCNSTFVMEAAVFVSWVDESGDGVDRFCFIPGQRRSILASKSSVTVGKQADSMDSNDSVCFSLLSSGITIDKVG